MGCPLSNPHYTPEQRRQQDEQRALRIMGQEDRRQRFADLQPLMDQLRLDNDQLEFEM